ncbi:MAG TPA: hypothetical protein VIG74_02320 [Alphaproteobacteria bacterium]|jgi:hypothetical protein
MKHGFIIVAVLMLAACVTTQGPESYFQQKNIALPTPENFAHCRGYGCHYVDTVSLKKKDWKEFEKLFKKAKPAEAEREAIKKAIGLFEKKVGAITGTAEDKGGTYVKIGARQHDCVDESTNTTIYLSLLSQKKLLKFHTVGTPQSRLPILSGRVGPHQTAVIIESATGENYAVDSWFHDNGEPAEIAGLREWFYGWRPQ